MPDPSGPPDILDTAAPPPPLDFSAIPPEALDDQQHVACELPCRVCQYNLRTLHAYADCPECGTAVHWSLVGDLLRFADADWVNTLARGMLWVILAILLSFVLSAAVSVLDIFIGVYSGNYSTTIIGTVVVSVLGLLGNAYGNWLLTSPEPQTDNAPAPHARLRVWARWLLMTSAALGLIGLAFQFAFNDLYSYAVPATSAMTIAQAAASILDILNTTVGIVGLFCLGFLLRRLARRAPDDGIARQTTILIWIWSISFGLIFLVFGVIWVIENLTPNGFANPFNDDFNVFVILGCGFMIALLGVAIWTLVLLIRYQRLFKRHAGYARFRVPHHRVASLQTLAPGQ